MMASKPISVVALPVNLVKYIFYRGSVAGLCSRVVLRLACGVGIGTGPFAEVGEEGRGTGCALVVRELDGAVLVRRGKLKLELRAGGDGRGTGYARRARRLSITFMKLM